MSILKKIILRFGVGVVVLVSAGALVLSLLPSIMCTTTVFDVITSPSRQLQAILFEIDCGATTSFNRQVSIESTILKIDRTRKNISLPTSFFAAKGDREIRLRWLSANHLEIQYPEGTVLYREDRESNGVEIDYKPFSY